MKNLTLSPLLAALFLCALASPLGAQTPQTSQAPDAKQVATQMQAFYKKTKDFQASFKQTYTDLAAGDKKMSYGRVFFKTPGKMRWDYFQEKKGKQHPQKTMVSDGANFWIYEHDFRQVFKECLQSSKLPTSLRFLMGQGELLKDFDVSLDPKSTPAHHLLTLVPKQPTAKYKELRFVVDAGTYQVLKTTIFDPYGNTNEIVFDIGQVQHKPAPTKALISKPPRALACSTPSKSVTCPRHESAADPLLPDALPAILCQPDETNGCGVCCGMYNDRHHAGDQATIAALRARTVAFGATADIHDPDSLKGFRRRWEPGPQDKLLDGLPACPFLGLIHPAPWGGACRFGPHRRLPGPSAPERRGRWARLRRLRQRDLSGTTSVPPTPCSPRRSDGSC